MESTNSPDLPPAPVPAEPEASTSTLAPDAAPILSKTAQKKLAKRAAHEAARPARRLAEKNKKKAKAVEKRKLIELGVMEKDSGPDKRKLKNMKKVYYGAKVVVDLGFDDLMIPKEIASMRSQLSTCYAVNRLTTNPVPLIYTSFNGKLKAELDNIGTTHESWTGIEWWEESYEELWSDVPAAVAVEQTEDEKEAGKEGEEVAGPTALTTTDVPLVAIGNLKGRPRSRVPKSSIIYLSGDSPNILSSIDPTKTYIIGGIVDKNRYKSLCLNKAISQGLAHAQLPLGEFLPQMGTRRVLTVNHVVEIIVKWIEMRDWEKAFLAVMPQRKFKVDENNAPGGSGGSKGEGEKKDSLEGAGDGAAGETTEQKNVYVAQDDDEEEEELEIITEIAK